MTSVMWNRVVWTAACSEETIVLLKLYCTAMNLLNIINADLEFLLLDVQPNYLSPFSAQSVRTIPLMFTLLIFYVNLVAHVFFMEQYRQGHVFSRTMLDYRICFSMSHSFGSSCLRWRSTFHCLPIVVKCNGKTRLRSEVVLCVPWCGGFEVATSFMVTAYTLLWALT